MPISEIEHMRMEESAAMAQYIAQAEPYPNVPGKVAWNEATTEAAMRMGYTDWASVPLEWWGPILSEAGHIKYHGMDAPYFGIVNGRLLRKVNHWVHYNFDGITTCWIMDDFGNLVGLNFDALYQFLWVYWMDGTMHWPH